MRKALQNKAQELVGHVLRDRWHVDHLIDVGGIAAVYAATHRNGNRVAIKMMHSLYALEPDVRRRFLEEGYVANRVGHPDAVTVLDDGELEDGTPFLVMELLDGESLEQLLSRRKTLPVEAVAIVADRVLDVLAAGHEQGVVHRDIKPPNIFLTRGAGVKVLDFGLARMMERPFKGSATKTGVVMGTASYMPPEQARGKRDLIDGRTDIWAMGATMFTALTDHYVHEGATGTERLILAASAHARSVTTLAPDLPAAFASIVDKALRFQRSERFSNAREMQAAVRAAYQATTGQALPSVEPAAGSLAPWSSSAGTRQVDAEPTEMDLPISVVFEPDSQGSSMILELVGETGRSDRYALKSKPHEADDEISDVIVVELED